MGEPDEQEFKEFLVFCVNLNHARGRRTRDIIVRGLDWTTSPSAPFMISATDDEEIDSSFMIKYDARLEC